MPVMATSEKTWYILQSPPNFECFHVKSQNRHLLCGSHAFEPWILKSPTTKIVTSGIFGNKGGGPTKLLEPDQNFWIHPILKNKDIICTTR